MGGHCERLGGRARQARRTRRENPSRESSGAPRIPFVLLLCCSFTGSFAQSMMNIALPEVAERFSVTISQANWLVAGYMVVAATTITLGAFLQARLGARRTLLLGAGCIAVGSALALVAPSFLLLMACRMVQAAGTGMFYPMVTATIMATSPPASLGTRLAVNSGIIAAGLAISPLVSGLVLTVAGWPALFAVPLVLAVALLAAALRFAGGEGRAQGSPPSSEANRLAASADVPSVALSLAGLSGLILGLSEITHDAAPAAAAMAAGAVALGLFAFRQLHLSHPLLNLRPPAHTRFTAGELLVMVGMMSSYAQSLMLPLYYQGALGFTAFAAGALLLGPVLVNAAFTFLGGRLYDRYGIWPLVPAGVVLVLAGQVGMFFAAQAEVLGAVAAASALSWAGVGFVVAPSKTTALRGLPQALYPHGASINSVLVQIASAVGSSLFVGVLSADVLRDTAAGASKQAAYAGAFSHALVIAMGIAVVGLVLAVAYAWRSRSEK